MRAAALLAAAVGGGALLWRWRRDQDMGRRWRAGLLEGCEGVLEHARTGVDRSGMPTLNGLCEGLPVDLALILDDAGYRKLPVLWLSATCAARLQPEACFDALAREQGTEFFSPASGLSVRLDPPPAWPAHVSLRTDREAVLPEPVAQAGTAFFALEAAKEMVVSPRGARLVLRVAEARRPEYLVLRQARFDVERVAPDTARELVQSVVRLVRRLSGATGRD